MTDQEALEKAIQKAVDGGYAFDCAQSVTSWRVTVRNGQAWVCWFNDDGWEDIQDIEHVIYDKAFAKALWGEEFIQNGWIPLGLTGRASKVMQVAWSVHLQQMVIAENPIKYLGENI